MAPLFFLLIMLNPNYALEFAMPVNNAIKLSRLARFKFAIKVVLF